MDKACVRLKRVSPISSLSGGGDNLPAVNNIKTEIGKWLIAALVITLLIRFISGINYITI